MQKLKIFSKILSITLTVILAVLLAGNVYSILVRTLTNEEHPKFFGFSSAVVISGSMSGTIEVNDLVICLEKSEYGTGDIITYVSESGSLVTHRIISESDVGFITKGDANNTPDTVPVSQSNITGKVVCVIPKIGSFIEFMRTPLGLMCLTLAGFIIFYLPCVIERNENSRKSSGDIPMNGGSNDGSEN